MIDILGYIPLPNEGRILISWNYNDAGMDDFEASTEQLKELLLNAGYIDDYNAVDVAMMINGRKEWMLFERWLSDECSEQLCYNILHQYITTQNA